MDIMLLHRQGLSKRKIADRLGIHRKTVSRYIRKYEVAQGVEESRPQPRASKLDRFHENISVWLSEDIGYQATWVYDRLCNMGFDGSYEIVKRRVSQLKAERQRIAYIRFETEPGCQAQVDFGEFQVELPTGNIKKYYLFSMILGYSRKIYAALVERCDLPTFLDCHIEAFAHFGGVPQEILYDRMKNVYIGKIAGKDKFNDTLTAFALHYGFKPEVAPAYASWVKGKVERPFSFIREGFWRGYGFISLQLANRDLAAWLSRKDERIHGTTHEKVSVRFDREQPHLQPLSPKAFDTSYRIYRKVQKDCTISFEGNRYVVCHHLVGKQVILRVKDKLMRIFDNDLLVVTYDIPDEKGSLVADKRFYEALKKDREMNRRKYGNARRVKGRAKKTISPAAPAYDMEVETRPVEYYDEVAS